MKRMLLLALSGLLLASSTAVAQRSIPSLAGRIVDEARMLSGTTMLFLDNMIAEHEDRSRVPIAMLTVTGLGAESIDEFATHVASRWRIGVQNGVLIVVVEDRGRIQILVGSQVQDILPEEVARQIVRAEMTPLFRRGDYDAGAMAGVRSIIDVFRGHYQPARSNGLSADRMPVYARIFFGLLFLAIPAGLAVFALISTGCARWMSPLFLLPFFFAAGFVLTASPRGGAMIGIAFLITFVVMSILVSMFPQLKRRIQRIYVASRTGQPLPIGIGGMQLRMRRRAEQEPEKPFRGGGAAGGW